MPANVYECMFLLDTNKVAGDQAAAAKQLHTILERVVEEVSFAGSDLPDKRVTIDGGYVRGRLKEVLEREDLSKFGDVRPMLVPFNLK